AVKPDIVARAAAQQLMTRDVVDLARDIPERDINSRDGGSLHDIVAVPEMLAVHHLPEVLDPSGIFANQELRHVLDRADDGTGMPFQRRLAPAPEALLVGDDFHENPVAHFRVTYMGLYGNNLHITGLRSAAEVRTARTPGAR